MTATKANIAPAPASPCVLLVQAIVAVRQPAVHYIAPAAGDQYHTHDNCNSFLPV